MRNLENRLKAFYELRATEEPENDTEAFVRFRKALRAAELSSGQRLLDVGAKWGGLGLCAHKLELDIDYTGLDLSEANVQKAADLGLDVRLADASQPLPIGDHEYDCIICLELLEHLLEPIALLSEFRRVLRAEGRVVISVPNPYSWVEIFREVFRRPDPEGHLNAFTAPVMENVLALAGFQLERILGTSVRIPKTLRLLSTDSMLARSRIYVACPAERVTFAGREL
jgi:2-polyprenyl-3-methyl-5-hydroxy-6-metoxy-1,4-benzoquinol methylase